MRQLGLADLVATLVHPQPAAAIDRLALQRLMRAYLHLNYSYQLMLVALIISENVFSFNRSTLHGTPGTSWDEEQVFLVNRLENEEQLISVSSLSKGFWKIKISWAANGMDYYDEKAITF